MIWAETQTPKSGDVTLEQMRDFLEPQAERKCVPVWTDPANPNNKEYLSICSNDVPTVDRPLVTLPKRAGAICRSNDDENKMKNVLEQLCRMAGKRCNREMKAALK
jgi:hypothetical protein